jgi:hypothetical protein
MIRALLIIAAQIIAFWPVWRWYAARVGGSTDEAWGLLPAFACVAYFIWRGKTAESDTVKLELLFPALLVLTYAASYGFLPPLLRAVVAATAIGCTASLLRFGRHFHPGILGLLYCHSHSSRRYSSTVVTRSGHSSPWPLRRSCDSAASR